MDYIGQQRNPLRRIVIVAGVLAFHLAVIFGIQSWMRPAPVKMERLIRVDIVPDHPARPAAGTLPAGGMVR